MKVKEGDVLVKEWRKGVMYLKMGTVPYEVNWEFWLMDKAN